MWPLDFATVSLSLTVRIVVDEKSSSYSYSDKRETILSILITLKRHQNVDQVSRLRADEEVERIGLTAQA
jgi:hypothetical protein